MFNASSERAVERCMLEEGRYKYASVGKLVEAFVGCNKTGSVEFQVLFFLPCKGYIVFAHI